MTTQPALTLEDLLKHSTETKDERIKFFDHHHLPVSVVPGYYAPRARRALFLAGMYCQQKSVMFPAIEIDPGWGQASIHFLRGAEFTQRRFSWDGRKPAAWPQSQMLFAVDERGSDRLSERAVMLLNEPQQLLPAGTRILPPGVMTTSFIEEMECDKQIPALIINGVFTREQMHKLVEFWVPKLASGGLLMMQKLPHNCVDIVMEDVGDLYNLADFYEVETLRVMTKR